MDNKFNSFTCYVFIALLIHLSFYVVSGLQIVLFHPYTLRLIDNPCLRHIPNDITQSDNVMPIYIHDPFLYEESSHRSHSNALLSHSLLAAVNDLN